MHIQLQQMHVCVCASASACACECIIFQLFLKMDSAVAVAVTVDVIHVFDTKLGFSHHFPSIAANDLICAQVHLHSVLRALPLSTSITRTQYILSRRSTYIRMRNYVTKNCVQVRDNCNALHCIAYKPCSMHNVPMCTWL